MFEGQLAKLIYRRFVSKTDLGSRFQGVFLVSDQAKIPIHKGSVAGKIDNLIFLPVGMVGDSTMGTAYQRKIHNQVGSASVPADYNPLLRSHEAVR